VIDPALKGEFFVSEVLIKKILMFFIFFISILVSISIGLIAIYIWIFVLQWRKYRLLQQKIDKLTQEIETLKQQRIVNS